MKCFRALKAIGVLLGLALLAVPLSVAFGSFFALIAVLIAILYIVEDEV